MVNKKNACVLLAMVLAAGLALSGCKSLNGSNAGYYDNVSYFPAKDFTPVGLVFTENVVENNEGEIFTYQALLKQAKELGADTMINIAIDTKKEGTFLGSLALNTKNTWYGSALAVKYVEGTIKVASSTATTVSDNGMVNHVTTGETLVMGNQSTITASQYSGRTSAPVLSAPAGQPLSIFDKIKAFFAGLGK